MYAHEVHASFQMQLNQPSYFITSFMIDLDGAFCSHLLAVLEMYYPTTLVLAFYCY